MFFSFRDGKAGLGNDHLYRYSANDRLFTFVGTHLTGIRSNPYAHGLNWRNGRLHVSWVYRGFVSYPGWDDPLDTKHKQQAGPNGAENNHDICYAYSDDFGYTWANSAGKTVARLREGETITNDTEGIAVFQVPKGSGLTNQEAQAVDQEGGVHVLNRDTLDGGKHPRWKHYYRSPTGECCVSSSFLFLVVVVVVVVVFSRGSHFSSLFPCPSLLSSSPSLDKQR